MLTINSPLYAQLDKILNKLKATRDRTHYTDVATQLGFSTGRDQRLHVLLGLSMEVDRDAEAPLRCSLVVRQAKGKLWRPGRGYFEHAKRLGFKMPKGEIAFHDDQLAKLHVVWP